MRYIITQLNDKFAVTDSRSSRLVIVNSAGEPADNYSQWQYFGLDKDRAEKLAADLNSK